MNKMTERKRYVTARIVSNNSHIIIDAENPMGCFRVAQQLHKHEDQFVQIRLRATKPSLKTYTLVEKIQDILQIGA